MKRIISTLMILLFAVAAQAPQNPDENSRVLRCKYIKSRPHIDGKLDENTWLAAERASGFWLLNAEGKASIQTEVRAAYDSEYLYFAFTCEDPNPDEILMRYTRRDAPLWWDDCVEVFMDINHDHKTYYHLITNALAARYDAIGQSGFRKWNPKWQVATTISEDSWYVEIAIPFREMGISSPQPGTIWGFNLNRQRYSAKVERSSWAETLFHFHEPDVFGHLQFMPFF